MDIIPIYRVFDLVLLRRQKETTDICWMFGRYPPSGFQVSGRWAGAAIWTDPTNQSDRWLLLAHIQSQGEKSNHRKKILIIQKMIFLICLKVHLVRTFTFLKKCKQCSLFALFSPSANEQFVLSFVRVRTFLFALSRTNGNPSCCRITAFVCKKSRS